MPEPAEKSNEWIIALALAGLAAAAVGSYLWLGTDDDTGDVPASAFEAYDQDAETAERQDAPMAAEDSTAETTSSGQQQRRPVKASDSDDEATKDEPEDILNRPGPSRPPGGANEESGAGEQRGGRVKKEEIRAAIGADAG